METLYPTSYMSNSDWFLTGNSQSSIWTKEENKRFESALALYGESTPDRWVKVAALIPGKTVFDVIKQYRELEEDVCDIEAGKVPIPGYLSSSFTLEVVSDGTRKRAIGVKSSDHERKKGVPWTEDEHRRFLLGLIKYGKGDWRNISRNYVISKTPTQVASHAQKYFIRQLSEGKDKRRPSIHDITTLNLTNSTTSENHQSKMDSELNAGGAAMVFGSGSGNNISAFEFGSNGLKVLQEQNLYANAYHGAHFRPRNSVF